MDLPDRFCDGSRLQLGRVNAMRCLARCAPGELDLRRERHSSVRNGKRNRDLNEGSGSAAPIEIDLPAMILDNFLSYCEAQSTAFGLTVADKWSKDESLNH